MTVLAGADVREAGTAAGAGPDVAAAGAGCGCDEARRRRLAPACPVPYPISTLPEPEESGPVGATVMRGRPTRCTAPAAAWSSVTLPA